jgi:hypothetical protein
MPLPTTNIMRDRRALYLVVWVGLVVTVVTLESRPLWEYYSLVRAGAKTTAIITETRPASHRTIYYTYSVRGESYTGSSQGHAGVIGDKIEVFYLPSDPRTVSAGNPRALLLNEGTFALLLATVAPTLGVTILAFRLRQPVRSSRRSAS